MKEVYPDPREELGRNDSLASVDHDAGVVVVEAEGPVQPSRAVAGVRAARRLANELGYSILFDLSRADVSLSLGDAYFLPRDPKVARAGAENVAIVFGDDEPADWARFAELTSANVGIAVRFFSDREEAYAALSRSAEARRARSTKLDARILVVDDDPDILASSARVIRNAGYEVFEAGTGIEAIEVALREVPDLVLLDVVLPDIDGVEVCRRIRSEAALEDTVVALASSIRTSLEDQGDSLDCRPDAYLRRPLSNKELVSSIEFLLSKRELEEASPGAR